MADLRLPSGATPLDLANLVLTAGWPVAILFYFLTQIQAPLQHLVDVNNRVDAEVAVVERYCFQGIAAPR